MASITITTTPQMDARLAPAFGALLHPGTNATAADVKAWLVQEMRNVVQQYETQQAMAALAAPAAFDPT
jgi:hypothetical protein